MGSGNITPAQFEQACKNAVKVVSDNMGNILINATNIGSGEMQYRVFNQGKTTAGTQMKYRKAPSAYTKLRQDAGLQVRHKDLQFTGDLFYSMNILTTKNNEVVYGFNNDGAAQIAEWQETSKVQVHEPIFDLSEKEVNLMEAQFARDVTRIFTSALENFPEIPTVKRGTDPVKKSIARNKQKKAKAKKIQQKSSITDKFAKQKQIKEKKSASVIKKQEQVKKAQQKIGQTKSESARAKAIESLNKKKLALEKSKKSALDTRTRLRKTRAKYKRITGKRK